jgi:electron transport complex protein RnfE
MGNDNTQSIMTSATVWNGLFKENPTFGLMLGMCPTLAVTTTMEAALTMGISVIFVLIGSNIMISVMRRQLKPHLRILMFTLTIAVFVTIADQFLKAYQPVMSEYLGAYIPLIIVNCIIICRSEACASKRGVWISTVDGLAMGVGFTMSLSLLASIREILASGKWLGMTVLPLAENGGWFVPWVGMGMPVGAFVTLGLLLGLAVHLTKKAKG